MANQQSLDPCIFNRNLMMNIVILLLTHISLTIAVTVTGVSNNPGFGRRYLLAGDTLDLECWSKKENDFTLEWVHNNDVIGIGQENPSVLSTQGYPASHPKGRTKLQLEWRNVDLNQTGSFSCKDMFEDTYFKSVFVIDIRPDVQKLASPIPDGSVDGRVAVRIQCNVYGIPSYAYAQLRWYKDFNEILGVEQKGKMEIDGDENSLTIYDPGSSDRGNYMCALSTLGNTIETFNRTVFLGSEYVGSSIQICAHWTLITIVAMCVLLV